MAASQPPEPPPFPLEGLVPAQSPLREWLREVRDRHPQLQAARARVLAARLRTDAVRVGFRDPVLATSAGITDGPGNAPFVALERILPSDSVSAQGGIEAPLGAGVYGGAGLSLRQLDDSDDTTQWTGGARLRMPLLRDRGYRGMQLEELLRNTEVRQAEAGAGKALETLTRDLVLAYVAWHQQIADSREVGRAMTRAEKLLEETSTRAELQVVPGYQVFPARFEAALRREELESSREQIRILRRTLEERLGRIGPVEFREESSDLLVRWAETLAQGGPLSATNNLPAACARRSDYQALEARILAAEVQVRMAAEERRSDLSIQAGLHWDQDDTKTLPGASDPDDFGYEMAVLFRRSLGRRGEKARLEAAKAELDALLADLVQLQVTLTAEISRALTAWEGACTRLALAQSAVREAGRVLAAEDERFALGEGTSRNVLDAQKDLTSASRRHVAVAGQVVAARVELQHALGLTQNESKP